MDDMDIRHTISNELLRELVIEGYKEAQQDKMYSEDQLIQKGIDIAAINSSEGQGINFDKCEEDKILFVQSLSKTAQHETGV